MVKDQPRCSHSQGMTALFFSLQSLMSLAMLADHPAWHVLPRFMIILFLPIVFHLFLCSSVPGSKVENILPAKLAKKSEATPEGLCWHGAGSTPFLHQGQSWIPRSLPRTPQGFVVTRANGPPSSSCRSHTSPHLLFSLCCSKHGPWLVSTNWPLAMILIHGCGANKNVPTFLANLPAVFVQISAGH